MILARPRSKETEEVTAALAREMDRLPAQLKKTLTWDRGSELAGHVALSLASEIGVYFCDPYRTVGGRGVRTRTRTGC